MNAERLEIARRFVACPGWVWLPGMLAASRHEDEIGATSWRIIHVRSVSNVALSGRMSPDGQDETCDIGLWECIPDLDDDLTRLGVLAVVRRAWGDPLMFVTYDDDSMSYAGAQFVDVWLPSIPGPLPIAVGPTEEAALLAALEAAPK